MEKNRVKGLQAVTVRLILQQSNVQEKARAAIVVAEGWIRASGGTAELKEAVRLAQEVVAGVREDSFETVAAEILQYAGDSVVVPMEAARPEKPEILPPNRMPRRGKGSRSMLHALAHIESVAIDLSFDMVARFGGMPENFYSEWVQVGVEEAKHFTMLEARLRDGHQTAYGDLPGHSGLWEAAMETREDVRARLAIEHMVHEGRGLDRLPFTVRQFEEVGDLESAKLLRDCIGPDEITHVAAGLRWFQYVCEQKNLHPIPEFHRYVRTYHHGELKPPFNFDAREAAGMTSDYYLLPDS